MSISCNPDKQEQEEDISEVVVAPPQQAPPAADTLALQEEEQEKAQPPAAESLNPPPAARQPAAKPAPQAAETKEQSPARPPQGAASPPEATYQLEAVQGEPLPLVLDMTPDCDVKLIKGTLTLRNGRFVFNSLSTQECSGSPRKQESHEARGTYKLENGRIFLNVETGEMLGDATGVVEENTIRLQQISHEEEMQEVDWVFRLR